MSTFEINAALIEKAKVKTGINDSEELIAFALQRYFEKKFDQDFNAFYDEPSFEQRNIISPRKVASLSF